MRVITGSARGMRLREPSNYDIRPTTGKVKEAMFSIVQFSVPGARVLDLFAGTGQLGIEALSRGAAEAVFVDSSPEALRLVTENLRHTGLEDRARVRRGDSIAYLKSGEKFDLMFLDPPYSTDLLEKAIKFVDLFDILREDGIMICESERRTALPDLPEGKYLSREYAYGRIKLTTFQRAKTPEK